MKIGLSGQAVKVHLKCTKTSLQNEWLSKIKACINKERLSRQWSNSRNTYSKRTQKSNINLDTARNSECNDTKNYVEEKLYKISEYMVRLSLLILELQKY